MAVAASLEMDGLINRPYKFDQINEGLKLLATGNVARVVVPRDVRRGDFETEQRED